MYKNLKIQTSVTNFQQVILGKSTIRRSKTIPIPSGIIPDESFVTKEILNFYNSELAEELSENSNIQSIAFFEDENGVLEEIFNDTQSTADNWDKIWATQAFALSLFSKCSAYQVGALVVYKNSIISSGVNGSIPGKTNCSDLFRKVDGEWYERNETGNFIKTEKDAHHHWSDLHEVHAEMNALLNIHENIEGLDASQLKMYITHTPCFNCAKAIAKSGIKSIYALYPYDNSEEIISVLNENDVKVDFFNANGES